MKKLLLFAALLLSGGVLSAEPIQNGSRVPDSMTIWKSTNLVNPLSTGSKITNSAFLHQVIVSSPTASRVSTAAVTNIWPTHDGTGLQAFRIQNSTNEYTSGDVTRWTFDTYLATAMFVSRSSENAAGNLDGNVQLIYQNGPPSNFRVWSSSFIPADIATHTIASKGPVLLHKVSVLKKGAGVAPLKIYNSNNSTSPENLIANIDLTAGMREYDFDIMLSSGLTVNVGTGTTNADVAFFYKVNPPRDWEYWTPKFASGTITAANGKILTGRSVFGGVLNGDNVTDSEISIYDSNGAAANPVATIAGDTVFDFDDANYEVHLTTGITFATKGNGQYTIRYRRLR